MLLYQFSILSTSRSLLNDIIDYTTPLFTEFQPHFHLEMALTRPFLRVCVKNEPRRKASMGMLFLSQNCILTTTATTALQGQIKEHNWTNGTLEMPSGQPAPKDQTSARRAHRLGGGTSIAPGQGQDAPLLIPASPGQENPIRPRPALIPRVRAKPHLSLFAV